MKKVFRSLQYFPENQVKISEALVQLGKINKTLGEYKSAKESLTQSLVSFEKYYGKDHIAVGKVIMELGKIDLLQEQIESSEIFLMQALKILQDSKHPERYLCLESLADLYSKKSMQAKTNSNNEQAQSLQKKLLIF